MWRWFSLAMAAALIMAAGQGCAKRVPVQGADLDAKLKLVVHFKDGSTITGRIGIDEHVELLTGGMVYRAKVFDVTTEEILLQDCRVLRAGTGNEAEWQRMVDARRGLGQEVREFTFARDQIDRVEHVKLDPLRTASQSAFWTVAGTICAFLLAEKS